MSAFPPDLPQDLDNPAIILAHDWQAFRQLATMENHWERPGWIAGRRSYHWMLSFHAAAEIQRLAKQCQARLPSVALDLVPPDALHLTIGRIGFTDELAQDTVLSAAHTALLHCRELAPLALTVGPLAGSSGAIRFSIAPWSSLLTLHRALTAVTQAAIGERCVMDTGQFRPHLSIAYANATVPVVSLLPTLERLRLLPPVSVIVPSAALVELRREGRSYRYETVAELPLGDG